MNELTNKPLALEMEHLSPYGPQWETTEGGSEICKTRLWKCADLTKGALLGEPGGGRGFVLPQTLRDRWRRTGK
jgi:hypothetical protein